MHRMMVLAKAMPGRVEELARWYDESHIPDLLAVPGVLRAERHAIMPLKAPPGTDKWDFLLSYDFEGENPMTVLQAMGVREKEGGIVFSDALDRAQAVSMIATSAFVATSDT